MKAITKSKVKDWLDTIFEAFIVIFILYFLLWPISIDGNSMEDTFSSGNKVIVSRIAKYKQDIIRREDIILCKITVNNEEITAVKRVIGLPGDIVYISSGQVYINNKLINENYIQNQYTEGEVNIILNDDQYFVMGDNRDISFDSRRFGPLYADKIIAKVIFKFSPIKEFTNYL